MAVLADVHTHILPGIDDGSPDVETSLRMLEREAERGREKLVFTPHFYARHDSPERFLARRARAWDALREALPEGKTFPKFYFGAEVHYFDGMSESESLRDLTITGTDLILVEFPFTTAVTQHMLDDVAAIPGRLGLTPIIAHMDRYMGRIFTNGIPEKFNALPGYVQVNATFFLDRLSRPLALRLLKEGKIQLLASDCHNMGSRPPHLDEATDLIEKALGSQALDAISALEREILP